MDSTAEQRAAFGAALRHQLRSWLRSDFADAVAKRSGESCSENAISLWLSGRAEPTRPKVYAMEHVLGLAPGALSRHLGYLPVDVNAEVSVGEAIDADPNLNLDQRVMLRAAWKAATARRSRPLRG